MDSRIRTIGRLIAGTTLAVLWSAALNSTVVYAAGCCTQCVCVNLCINDDGCGSNSGILCTQNSTQRTCNGVTTIDWCDDHCRDTE